MKILIDNAIPFIHNRFSSDVEVVYLPAEDFTSEKVKEADVLIIRTRTKCNSDLLEGSKVKLIVTATIGLDHIDAVWCEKKGIKVQSCPGCNAPGVAQYVFASLFKNGFDTTRHTLGVVGYGNVGSIVSKWAKDMNIKVLISDEPRKAQGLKDVDYLPLEEVMKLSDAVTFHVPLTNDGKFPTFHLIGNKELENMKPGAILVNSSRGGIIDEKALKEALRKRKILTITDVWEGEPKIDEELVQLNAVSTPHIAGYSKEGKIRATRMSLEAVEKIMKIPVDYSGLQLKENPMEKMTRELIERSYNPITDSDRLKENPKNFELLRNLYEYRPEPFYIN